MSDFYISKGRNIKLKGAADKKIVARPVPSKVAVQPQDFRGIKPKLTVHVGDAVQVGTPVLFDKNDPAIKVVSPASGKIAAINRGAKRALQEIVVETDGRQEALTFQQFAENEIKNISRKQVVEQLLTAGLWPCIRQRPFSKIAHPKDTPKAIFIQAMNTEPLALDYDVVLSGKEKIFQAGINVIRRLTEGDVHLSVAPEAQSKALTNAEHVQIHRFYGPHPAGNVSTHIHYIDPINKGELVWYLNAWDVARIGELFLQGKYPTTRYVAITGEGVQNRNYVQTVEGASVSSLLEAQPKEGMRYISGSVLRGKDVGNNGFVCFYDAQLTVIPEGGRRTFLGWLSPGFEKYSFSRMFASSFLPKQDVSLDTDTNGSDRTIVLNHIYDQLVPLDVMTYFLIRALAAKDIEEAEKLGILECDEEDFALCSFACPSKTDVGAIVRAGLDLIEKEG